MRIRRGRATVTDRKVGKPDLLPDTFGQPSGREIPGESSKLPALLPRQPAATADRTQLTLTFVLLLAANAAAWAWALFAFRGQPALIGTAGLAYVLGLRHAFDADHIAAIDNAVRKLMHEGARQPHGVGLYFSLGHSTVVVLASAGIAVGAAALHGGPLPAFADSTFGTLVSSLFLLAIGMANLIVLKDVWAALGRARSGEPVEQHELDRLFSGRGLLARLLRPLFRLVSKSWHMYPVGFLFGLGFDTATEIGLLAISAAQAAQGTSLCVIMIFPALFTAGMVLLDTADSAAMAGAYGWAEVKPARRLGYNLIVTAISVIVALAIGGLHIFGLIGELLEWQGGPWPMAGSLEANYLGFALAALFGLCWLSFAVLHRTGRRDEPRSAGR